MATANHWTEAAVATLPSFSIEVVLLPLKIFPNGINSAIWWPSTFAVKLVSAGQVMSSAGVGYWLN